MMVTGNIVTPAAAGSSFYTAMRILPRAQREAMYTVYAFCRAVDDIADGDAGRSERLALLEAWRRDLDRLFQGGYETLLTDGLLAPVAAFGLHQADFAAVIDGMEMDVRRGPEPPDWAALDLYCDRVASAVGRLSVRIFGVGEADGIALAHHLGRALQLTNILRDLDEDAAMRRTYLPAEALADAGITTAGTVRILFHPALDAACRQVAERAHTHFRDADAVMDRCPRAAVRSPRVMAGYYRSILDRLSARGFAPPRVPVRGSRRRLAWAVLCHGLV